LSFRKKFYIDPAIISNYPELDPFISKESNVEDSKRFIDLDEVYPNQFKPSIVPSVLIYSKITHRNKTTLQPVTKGQAFANLLKQSISIFFNRQVVSEHLNVLKRLVQQSNCYELFAGRDLYHKPDEILKILPRSH
jgi:hypothetical protein